MVASQARLMHNLRMSLRPYARNRYSIVDLQQDVGSQAYLPSASGVLIFYQASWGRSDVVASQESLPAAPLEESSAGSSAGIDHSIVSSQSRNCITPPSLPCGTLITTSPRRILASEHLHRCLPLRRTSSWETTGPCLEPQPWPGQYRIGRPGGIR